jgi:hypothetical protein
MVDKNNWSERESTTTAQDCVYRQAQHRRNTNSPARRGCQLRRQVGCACPSWPKQHNIVVSYFLSSYSLVCSFLFISGILLLLLFHMIFPLRSFLFLHSRSLIYTSPMGCTTRRLSHPNSPHVHLLSSRPIPFRGRVN